MARGAVAHGRILIDEIAIGVVLDHEAVDVPPVVEDLGAEDVPADAPDGLVFLLGEPLVAQRLGVEVVHFKGAVVHVLVDVGGQGRQEHGVVVDEALAAVDVGEERDFLAGGLVGFRVDVVEWDVEDVARHDVEVARVPVHSRGEVFHVEAKVAELLLVSRRLICKEF